MADSQVLRFRPCLSFVKCKTNFKSALSAFLLPFFLYVSFLPAAIQICRNLPMKQERSQTTKNVLKGNELGLVSGKVLLYVGVLFFSLL